MFGRKAVYRFAHTGMNNMCIELSQR